MNTELAVGVFGLVGAALGAGGAVTAGWVQQWQTAKYAARARREQRAIGLGEEALLQLVHLQRELEMAAIACLQGADADPDIAGLIRRFGRNAEVALIRLPGAPDLQKRMKMIFTCINGYAQVGEGDLIQVIWAQFYAAQAVENLGAFLREEKLPGWQDMDLGTGANRNPP